jgi:hypothetical protein
MERREFIDAKIDGLREVRFHEFRIFDHQRIQTAEKHAANRHFRIKLGDQRATIDRDRTAGQINSLGQERGRRSRTVLARRRQPEPIELERADVSPPPFLQRDIGQRQFVKRRPRLATKRGKPIRFTPFGKKRVKKLRQESVVCEYARHVGFRVRRFLGTMENLSGKSGSEVGFHDRGFRPDLYPTVPSICNSIKRFISTAYSIGSSLTSGSMKPLTIIVAASASVSPRLAR